MSVTILFVDDEPDLEALVQQKFRRQIREGAVKVMFAHDGLEALATIEQNPAIDMVVSDINMPRMDGLSLLAEAAGVRGRDAKSTVIVSAYGDMSNIRTAMNRGAFDFLTKPIDFGDLEATIDKTVRHVEMLREARRRQAEAERAHASLSRYFSPQIASRLASNGEDGDGMEVHRRDVATIFTDVTSFTTLVENIDARSAGRAAQRIYRRDDRRSCSRMRARSARSSATASISCSMRPATSRITRRARSPARTTSMPGREEFKQRWRAKGVNFGATRIGVHAGPALVGNFGGNQYFDYTAHGDTINTASRLETANKHLGTRICVSETVAEGARRISRAAPSATSCCAGAASRCAPMSRCATRPFRRRRPRNMPKPSPSSRPAMPPRCRPSPRWSACMPTIALAGFHLKRLLNGAKGVRMQLE